MSAIRVAQRKLKMAQALERQATNELVSAARLDALKRAKAASYEADSMEGGRRRRRKTTSAKTTKTRRRRRRTTRK